MAGRRRFELHRDVDITGVSGEGVVADGVEFDDELVVNWPDGQSLYLPPGWCRVVWRGHYRSTVLWPSVDQVAAVHGHDGATRVVWLDQS